MTPGERQFVVSLAAERAGLDLDERRSYLIESALAPLARREGFISIAELVRAARDRADERLAWAIAEALAPARTAFFRDPPVFEAVLAAIARRGAETVRVWSAACGSGQEVYSLAMLLEERSPRAPVELFGSDLNERLLEKAQAGIYSGFEVQHGLSARRLVRHFEKQADSYSLAPRLRQQVRWRRVNLLDDVSRLGRYQIVLCRYVLGSMVASARARVLAQLSRALTREGLLVLSPGDEIEAGAFGLAPASGAPGLFRLAANVAAAA